MNEVRGETSVIIQAPPGVIYDYLQDFTRHPEWVTNVQRVSPLAPGPARVGARYKTQEGPPPVPFWRKLGMLRFFIQGMLGGAKSYSIAEIVALEPGRRIAWRGGIPKGDGYFNLAEWEFVLEANGAGTRLVQRFHYQPQTAVAAGMIGAAGPGGIEAACAVNLARLKSRLEQGAFAATAPAG